MYKHKVNYYETDKMGITHHSNYVRWMEEARIDWLTSIGYGYKKLEDDGIISPVIGINLEYKESTTFDDEVEIKVWVKEFKGVKLVIGYEMKNTLTGKIVCTAESKHCFINKSGMPIRLIKEFPNLDQKLKEEYEKNV